MADVRIVIETDAGQSETIIKNLKNGLEEAGKGAKGSAQDFTTWAATVSTAVNQSWEVFQKASGKMKEFYNFAKERAEIAELKQHFSTLAASVGQYSQGMVEQFRRATEDTVADSELMKAAMLAMRKGVSTSQEELSRLFEIAKAKSELGFGSTIEVFDKMVEAIAKGNRRALIELGFLSESYGKAKDAAGLLMNRQEAMSVIMTQGAEDVALVAKSGDSAADSFDRLEVELGRVRGEFGDALLPIMADFVDYTRSDLVPALQGAVGLFKEWVGVTDDEAEALRKMGVAGRVAAVELEKARIAGELNKRSAGVGTTTRADMEANLEARLNSLGGVPGSALRDKLLNPQAGGYFDAQIQNYKKGLEEINKLQLTLVALDKEEGDLPSNHADLLKKQSAEAAVNVKKHEEITPHIKNHVSGTKAHKEAVKDLFQAYSALESKMKAMADPKILMGFAESMGTATTGYGFNFSGIIEASKIANAEFEKMQAAAEETNQNITSAFDDTDSMVDDMDTAFGDLLDGWEKEFPEKTKAGVVQIEKPLARVFADAMLTGVKSGDWLSTIRQGLAQVVTEAFSQKFPVMSQSGGLNVGNLGINLAAGFVMNRLTGPGGIFGSSVIHGQDQIAASGTLNQQVQTAAAQRDELLKNTVGLTSETRRLLENLNFQMTSTVAHKSGDGIFSKKTTTYEMVGGAAAQQAITELAAASAKALAESAKHNFEIAMTEMQDPAKALQMTMNDLKDALSRVREGTTDFYDISLKIAQIEKQRAEQQKQFYVNEREKNINYASMVAGNPYATSAANSVNLPFGISGSRYLQGRLAGATDTFGNDLTLNGVNVSNILDRRLAMASAEQQSAGEFAFKVRSNAAGGDLAAMNTVLQERKGFLESSLSGIKAIMDDAKAKTENLKLTEDQQADAFRVYQASMANYYAVKENILNIDSDIRNNLKTIQDKKAAEDLARAEEEARTAQQVEDGIKAAAKQTAASLNSQKNQWLQQALQSKSILTDMSVRGAFSDLIGSGGENLNAGLGLFEQSAASDFGLNKMRMEAGNDPLKLQAYYAQRAKISSVDAEFFLDIAQREKGLALDFSRALEERQASGERFKSAMMAYYDAMNEGLQIEADKQKEAQAKMDANKAAQERLTGDVLGTILTTLGERRTDAAGNIVVVPVNGVQDLGAALQKVMVGLDPAAASAIMQIVKNNAPGKIGGYFDS